MLIFFHISFVRTEDKGVDDDSRYGGTDYKTKNRVNGKVGCESCSNSKDGLKSNGQQQDETSSVPCTGREGVDLRSLQAHAGVKHCDLD